MSKHKHHIIPRYHCKELGIDPDFDENIVEVDRLDHARIHWGYKCDDLEPLFEYVTPAQWIIDLIPRGDNRDVGAAVLTAKGEIDGIDMSGENHPSYKNGMWIGTKGNKETANAAQREYRKTPYRKEYKRKWDQDNFEREKKRLRKYYVNNKEKVNNQARERRAKKKSEAQGEGTLEGFADNISHEIP